MRAYIKTFEDGNGYRAEVVTEQDYYECGPFARSYLSPYCLDLQAAKTYAENYCLSSRIIVVSSEDI
jgi:hypothetical protein